MPELPEVQTVVNDLIAGGLIGKTICGADVFWNKSIGNLTSGEFSETITGQIIMTVRRRAKYIIIDFKSAVHLLIHLRMSGRLIIIPTSVETNKHEHVILHLNDNRDLRFHDTRKFGRMILTDKPDTILGNLGPEPLSADFTVAQFKTILKSKHRQLKPLLLDQTFIAGLGNIYVDEALWEARLHPQKIAATVSPKKAADLYNAIRYVLQQGIDNQGTSLGNGQSNFTSAENQRGNNAGNLKIFRKTGHLCPRCQTKIERIIVGQRSSHICPKCQKA
ncbi:MAG: bifunctional DNA-formamidopyrimidine glycosylase/DNA-(apurinic or apyrimidinic site) lyase [Candidatus Marinimicrobia bacterium]|nr:bifunctional DNA-formamidopyrimidine glycosylase/DNA-(apurinic or apyrimidinic site) lyase [Candidatus Neomarinimicrobiota bacterium]